MDCPRCGSENRAGASFCIKCGSELPFHCQGCGKSLPVKAKFCDECGCEIQEPAAKSPASPYSAKEERKYITVLFSDLTGYTEMAERLDPEELKEVTSHIFGRVSEVIAKYEGFIEKYVGDAIVAIFGAHKAHEDDPVRAIRAAREIHKLVDAISPRYENRIGRPLSMHTGISTGIAVTGEINFQRGTHGVVGDTINLASRLSALGEAGDILASPHSYSQAEGFFLFEARGPTKLKGKKSLVAVYKVLAALDQPRKIHRLHGLRSEMVGREAELTSLEAAADRLREGEELIFSICGAPGTGKSRLVEEFKSGLDMTRTQWLEGHAYPYARNIPYFPLTSLLNRAFRIDESDDSPQIRKKIEDSVAGLTGREGNIIPIIGSLYNLDYPELEGINPEFWKDQLHQAIHSIISALSLRQPTIVCLEDLHWADPSSMELLRRIFLEINFSVLFICVYRPSIRLFTSQQAKQLGDSYHEVRLQDLSPSDTQTMLESLLGTGDIPEALRHFIQDRVAGNPFYLEEAINSLIDTETLVKENDQWRLTRPISSSIGSHSINGMISARLDRLDKRAKRVLQEASVIGRSFPREILKKVTEHKEAVQDFLDELVSLDLLRVRPDLQGTTYDFKHAIIQEVVYDGLLKKERQDVHQRIGDAIEALYPGRLAEFFETLAFHYERGKSQRKAVDYLIQSGKKSSKRYSVEEAHQYYRKAFHTFMQEIDSGIFDQVSLVRLLNTWSPVFYFRGSFEELEALLMEHLDLVRSLKDKEERGMFYVWLGMCLWGRARFEESYAYLHRALKLGEEIGSKRVIGYVGAWLPWPCAELGLFDEALVHAERARDMAAHFEADDYPYYQSLDSSAFVHFAAGRPAKIHELGQALLEYGEKRSSIRAITWGYFVKGWGSMAAGDFPSAISFNEQAIRSSRDPFYTQFPKLSLGMSYVSNQEFDKAEEPLRDVLNHAQKHGSEILGLAAEAFLGAIAIQSGDFSGGMAAVERAGAHFRQNKARWRTAFIDLILGEVYLNLYQKRKSPISLSVLFRNLPFLVKNLPRAARQAEHHFRRVIETAESIDAVGFQGQAHLGLAKLHTARRQYARADQCLQTAVHIFETCAADAYLEQARQLQRELES